MNKCDFSGWVFKAGLEYAGERVIHQNAFARDDGNIVPLLWIHGDYTRENMLGYAFLQNKDEGIYAYCMFNNTDLARHVKELFRRGDIYAFSALATGIEQDHGVILRGSIKEVSEAFIYTDIGISRKHVDMPECF